jgi:hypothetical protein
VMAAVAGSPLISISEGFYHENVVSTDMNLYSTYYLLVESGADLNC